MKSLCLLTTSTWIVSTQGFSQTTSPLRTPLHASIPNTNQCTALSACVTCHESTRTISKLSKNISSASSAELKALWSIEQDRALPIRGVKSGRYGGRATSGGSCPSSREVTDDWREMKVLGFDMSMVPSSRYDTAVDIEHGGDGEGSERQVSHRERKKIKKIPTKVRQNSPIKKQVASNLFQDVLLEGSKNYQLMNTLGIEFDANGNIKESIDQRNENKAEDDGENERVVKSAVPAWFPYIPTKLQIESLEATELRDACAERNLKKSGNKNQLQDRLSDWTKEQHERRVLERNGMLQTDYNQLDDALGQVDSNNGGIDGIEPLINRRKSLLRSKKPSPSLEKRILGFNLESTTSNFDINEKPEYLSSVAEESSATRNRIKESKSISSSIRRQERIRDRVDVSSPSEEYLSGLKKSFYQPQTSSSNNFQVKQLYLQAKHADQRGDIKGAKRLLNQLLQETPYDSRVLRRLSRLHIEEGNHNDARRILLSGLKSNPKDGHLLHGLARLELSNGDLDGARRDFKASIRATPEFPNPYHALGTLEHSMGKIRVATTVLRMGLKQCPTNHRLHHALGDLYRDAKMFDLAEKCYRTGLDCLDAESKYKGKDMLWSKSFLYTAMSYVSYEKNEKMECRTWLKKSIEQTGNRMHSQGWLGLAHLEESEGNISQARQIYQKALQSYELHRGIIQKKKYKSIKPSRLGDKWVEVYKSYARMEEREHNYDDANNIYSRTCIAFRDDWSLLQSWAQFQQKHGRDDRARTLFKLACDKAGVRSAKPYRMYAEFEMSKGNYLRAREILFLGAQMLSEDSNDDTQLQFSNDFPLLFHSWAICEWHLGNLDRVEVLFDHGLRLTDSGDTGSVFRSVILHSIARFLYHSRRDYSLAQHCVCLALSESLLPGGTSKIWYLWAKIARAMGNQFLEEDCLNQAKRLNGEREESCTTKVLGGKANSSSNVGGLSTKSMLRRAPWHYKVMRSRDAQMKIQFPDD